MYKYLKTLRTIALATTILTTTALAGMANAQAPAHSVKLLTANFDARQVVQVEVGDFHFKPGQVAPVHTHTAPAIGYVAKGTIIYQVEGGKVQILRAGDAFYEPTGVRILRFDNASATEEAIFLDFNLEQVNEPFIVFEKPPTEAIDRRALPTIGLDGKDVNQVNVHSTELQPAGIAKFANNAPVLGLVAEGVVEIQTKGQPVQRIAAGKSFFLPKDGATIVNASSEVSAKLITFRLR